MVILQDIPIIIIGDGRLFGHRSNTHTHTAIQHGASHVDRLSYFAVSRECVFRLQAETPRLSKCNEKVTKLDELEIKN